ncbi:MAG: hypothetical protein ACR2GR_11415 [Rhodothermales bacterium]
MSNQPSPEASGTENLNGPPGERARPTAAKSLSSLEKLRDRVEVAARELERLREENRALAGRLAELEANPLAGQESTFIPLDEDPELLRRKVSGFISAIDQYLGQDTAS